MTEFALTLPPSLVDAIALRVVELLEERVGLTPIPPTPYLSVDQAAEYIAAKPQRIYDLVSAGQIRPNRDGRRLLFKRADLDAYLSGLAA